MTDRPATASRAAGGIPRVLMHVDMDAFYAMVELRERPDLRGLPMMVGGAQRGVVLSATYEARAHGVRSGMPMSRARRLCPAAVVVPPRHGAYSEVSRAIFAILDTFTDVVQAASIDEAFLDVTGSLRRMGSGGRPIAPVELAEAIRRQVAAEQGITCSVGIAPTKFLAKLASSAAKPDGVCEVRPDRVLEFLHPLPVERMWGVGEATTEKLHRFGLRTVADLAETPVDTLTTAFGPHHGRMLHDLAWGRDARRVTPDERERSIGSSETFSEDSDDPAVIRRELLRMATKTAARARGASMMGRTVVTTIRYADFTTLTRSATLPSPTDTSDEIYDAAVILYEKLRRQRRTGPTLIRLVGVRLEGLIPTGEAYQQPMLSEPDHGWREAEQAMDAAIARFGPQAVRRAVLTRSDRHRSPIAGPRDHEAFGSSAGNGSEPGV